MSDTYLTLQIYRIRVALLKEGIKLQCVISYKNIKYELSNFEGKDAVFQWQDLLFNFDVKQNELDKKFKIEVFKKKGKVLLLLGSQEYEFRDFLTTVNRGVETTFDIEKKSKYAGSFHFNVEATSWKLIRDYLKESKDLDKAISIMTDLAKNNTPKLSSYMQSGVLQELMAVQRACTVVNPDAKNMELINKLLPVWEMIVSGQVDAGLLNFFAEMITVDLEVSKMGFMNCLKNFFTFTSHQEQMIKAGVMKTLIKAITSKNLKVFFKAAEVLFYFDEKFQKEMIKNGMIKQLMKVLTDKASPAEARTKSMSLLQYFDTKYQDELVSAGTLKHIIKIIQADSAQAVEGVVIKALAVIQRFTVDQLKEYVNDGFLKGILSVMALHTKPKVQESTIELINRMLLNFHGELVASGYLETLKKLLEDNSVAIALKCRFLSLMASEPADLLIKHDCVPSIVSLLQSEDVQLKLMTLQILTKQFSLPQLIEANLLPVLKDWLNGPPGPERKQTFTNRFMNEWAFAVMTTMTDLILGEVLALLLKCAQTDVSAFCQAKLLVPVIKLIRHSNLSIYEQATAIIDLVQKTHPEVVLQCGYLEEIVMTLAKSSRSSVFFMRVSRRAQEIPALYPEYIEYIKQWPELIQIIAEDLTTTANWAEGKQFVMDLAEKAPEYLTQFGLVGHFIRRQDVQVKLAPIVDKLPGVEEIMLEERHLQALKNHLSGYKKIEFLALAANILQKFVRKYPQEAMQSGIVEEITKIFFTAYPETSIEIAFNIMTLPEINNEFISNEYLTKMITDALLGTHALRKRLLMRWLTENPGVLLTMPAERQREMHGNLLSMVFESFNKGIIAEATKMLPLVSSTYSAYSKLRQLTAATGSESLAQQFVAKPELPYCSIELDGFDVSDMVVNGTTAVMCRQEVSNELAPEKASDWRSISSPKSIEEYQSPNLVTSARYFEVRVEHTTNSRIVIGLATDSALNLEYTKHHAFKPYEHGAGYWQPAVKPILNPPSWAQSPWSADPEPEPEHAEPVVAPPKFTTLSSIGYNCADGTVIVNGGAKGPVLERFGPQLKSGDVLGIFIENGTSTIVFYVNGQYLGAPAFPGFIYNSHAYAVVSMFDDGDSVTFLPAPVFNIPRRPSLPMDRYFENALGLIIKKSSRFSQTQLLYKASVEGWSNAVMHGRMWETVASRGLVFLLKSSQNNKRKTSLPTTSTNEAARDEANVFAIHCEQKSLLLSNYEQPDKLSSDVPSFMSRVTGGARPFLTLEDLQNDAIWSANDSNNNTNVPLVEDPQMNNNNNVDATEAEAPPPEYVPPPPPPPPEFPGFTFVPQPPPPPLPQLPTLTTTMQLGRLAAPKKAPNTARVSLQALLTDLNRDMTPLAPRKLAATKKGAPKKGAPKKWTSPKNKALQVVLGSSSSNVPTPKHITPQNCSAYQAKLVYLVANGAFDPMFENRNRLKIITPSMSLMSDVTDASIVLDLENKFFHVVNTEFEWDSYKLDDVEIYAKSSNYQIRHLIQLLEDSASVWAFDVLKKCYELSPESVMLELQTAYQDSSLASEVRKSLELFMALQLDIDLATVPREAAHPLINSAQCAAQSLVPFEEAHPDGKAVVTHALNNNVAPPPPPPPPAAKQLTVRERAQLVANGGSLHEQLNAFGNAEDELDRLLDDLTVRAVPTAEEQELERLLNLLDPEPQDKSESESGSGSGSGSESSSKASEPSDADYTSESESGSGSGSASGSATLPRFVPGTPPRLAVAITAPVAPVLPAGNRVPCPICGTLVLENTINEHLDECLTMQAIND